MKKIAAIICFVFVSSIIESSFIVANAGTLAPRFIENLTWVELQARLKAGADVVIVPIGGTAQNGPHMMTGAQSVIVRYAAGEIAAKLGDALVAPVIPYSPQGRIYPPEGHMQFPGTMSVSDKTFEALLEDTAGSLKQAGFHLICFIGEGGGTQGIQRRVAERLTDQWFTSGVIVLHVSDYYATSKFEDWNDSMGIKTPRPAAHAGLVETSQLMAIDATGVRDTLRADHSERDYKLTGAMSDSSTASAKLGRKYLGLKIEAAVKQIQNVSGHAQ